MPARPEAMTPAPAVAGRASLEIGLARTGRPVLCVHSPRGPVSLHSRYDPDREAEQFARKAEVPAGRTVVVLGLGLGYHVAALRRRLGPDTPMVVVEADPAVRDAAAGCGVFDPDAPGGPLCLTGVPPVELAAQIAALGKGSGPGPPVLLEHPPSVRAHPDYYAQVQSLMAPAAPLLGRLARPRLRAEQLRILILNTGYYLVREIGEAARRLGHETLDLAVPDRETGSATTLGDLLMAAAEWKPDFVLTVNHLGFDRQGILAGMLAEMRLPVASWFVDSPELILAPHPATVTDACSLFVWDRAFVPEMRALGFAHVHFLPLAADERLFSPPPAPAPATGLSFVGNSMMGPVEDYARRLGWVEPPAAVQRAARRFMAGPDRTPRHGLAAEGVYDLPECRDLTPQGRADLEALTIWLATRDYRFAVAEALTELRPLLVGDDGWRRIGGPERFRFHGPLDYYRDLPGFYPACAVNLNITSLQMKTAVNQRVFDVPACGAFLLTDHRPGIEDLFVPDLEAVWYREPEEAAELAAYFLAHPRARGDVARRARARVLAEHTYRHRLGRLIARMRRDHGR